MAEIIDYIVEQADRYDARNLEFEQDLIFNINRNVDLMIQLAISAVDMNIRTQQHLERLLQKITKVVDQFRSATKNIMLDKAGEYSDIAYDQCSNLIAIGTEVSNRFDSKIKEMASVQQDADTIEFIESYAFDLLTGYTNQKINELRSKLGYLMLQNKADKASVRELIQKILSTNKSKAEEIAQQELSMAFNHGMLQRMREWQRVSEDEVMKYWHGFKYSERTCEYCRSRIGNIYELDDDSEVLPAHVRCRCTWLPILRSWDKPVTNKLIAKANLLNLGYSREMMYDRINNRLNIRYAQYMTDDAMSDYLQGERSPRIADDMSKARTQYVKDLVDKWDIKPDQTRGTMSEEFNQQMKFWKKYSAEVIADNNVAEIDKTIEAIKGVMLLPWTADQLDKWNQLISNLRN